jgi:hypothetical protein
VAVGKECTVERLLPDGMVKPKEHTEEHVRTVLWSIGWRAPRAQHCGQANHGAAAQSEHAAA